MSVIPAVLLNALREYSFVGSPLWRMSDGKDLVRVELTVHKNLPTQRLYKKGVVGRRQPAPPAYEWPCQPAPAHLPTTTRLAPAHRPTPCVEKETPPPPTEILPDTTRSTITHDRTQKTAIIETAPTIVRPQKPPPTRQPAEEEDTNEVTNSARQQGEVPYQLRQLWSHTHSRESPWSSWKVSTSWSSKDSDYNAQMRRST